MFTKDLEVAISLAYKNVRVQRHKFMTVDDLGLALLNIPDVLQGLRTCGVDMEQFRHALTQSIEASAEQLEAGSPHDTQPTLEFQRVLQRAVYHAQSRGARQVTGVGVMTAIFGEETCHTVYHLKQQGVDRLTWINNVDLGGADPDVEPDPEYNTVNKKTESASIESNVSSGYIANEISGGSNRIAELEARVAMLEHRLAELEKKLP